MAGVLPGVKRLAPTPLDWSVIADLVGEGLALPPQARLLWLEQLGRSQPALVGRSAS